MIKWKKESSLMGFARLKKKDFNRKIFKEVCNECKTKNKKMSVS